MSPAPRTQLGTTVASLGRMDVVPTAHDLCRATADLLWLRLVLERTYIVNRSELIDA
jgi:hypothetical protein